MEDDPPMAREQIRLCPSLKKYSEPPKEWFSSNLQESTVTILSSRISKYDETIKVRRGDQIYNGTVGLK